MKLSKIFVPSLLALSLLTLSLLSISFLSALLSLFLHSLEIQPVSCQVLGKDRHVFTGEGREIPAVNSLLLLAALESNQLGSSHVKFDEFGEPIVVLVFGLS